MIFYSLINLTSLTAMEGISSFTLFETFEEGDAPLFFLLLPLLEKDKFLENSSNCLLRSLWALDLSLCASAMLLM